MIWTYFVYFAVMAILFWVAGAAVAWRGKKSLATALTLVGLFVFLAYIIRMWLILERPPLRTMGETRLWYSSFLPLAGLIVYVRYRYRWILSLTTVVSIVFICINLFKPEIHSKTLMPALQSPWFAPHVILYMLAYALLGAAALIAAYQLFSPKGKLLSLASTDDLVYIGYAFLTIAMLMGALWAKEAWGHYWSWDPKETWAAITWLSYLGYIHLMRYGQVHRRLGNWVLIIAFCLLQMCWWGINYLPSAQNGASIHTYSQQ